MNAPLLHERPAGGRTFRDLTVGDRAYRIERGWRGRAPYAVLEKVTAVYSDSFTTLPCYADGQPMIYFGTSWRRSSGVEFTKPEHRSKHRLVLDLPDGIAVAPPPIKAGDTVIVVEGPEWLQDARREALDADPTHPSLPLGAACFIEVVVTVNGVKGYVIARIPSRHPTRAWHSARFRRADDHSLEVAA